MIRTMRRVRVVLVVPLVVLLLGCGAKESSPIQVVTHPTVVLFAPLTPKAVEAAAKRAGICLALRFDAGKPTPTACAKDTPGSLSVAKGSRASLARCPVAYLTVD